jgi:energy-coupling factor transport system ATP-binding protein
MITASGLTFSYSNQESPVLKRVNFNVGRGELVLVTGPTGSGKSTLLKAIIGLAPHFTGGNLSGSLEIDGLQTLGKLPHELAHLIGYVNQQPEGGFATDTVEEELAYGMEQLGFSPETMKSRVSEIAFTLGLGGMLSRPLQQLSGGQQQRVAIGAALAAGQKILLLDEPTSALDDDVSLEVLALLKKLRVESGVTVVMSEHRTERVLPHADRIFHLRGDGLLSEGAFTDEVEPFEIARPARILAPNSTKPALEKKCFSKQYGDTFALHPIEIDLNEGEITSVTGANGSGKSSLLWCVLEEAWQQNIPTVMVPQTASDLLILDSVSAELAAASAEGQGELGSASRILEELVGRIDPKTHPRDLSSGQQLALTLAIQLGKKAQVVILDEPTRGLDYEAKLKLIGLLNHLKRENRAVLVATHDSNFANQIADRQIHLVNGGRANAS